MLLLPPLLPPLCPASLRMAAAPSLVELLLLFSFLYHAAAADTPTLLLFPSARRCLCRLCPGRLRRPFVLGIVDAFGIAAVSFGIVFVSVFGVDFGFVQLF